MSVSAVNSAVDLSAVGLANTGLSAGLASTLSVGAADQTLATKKPLSSYQKEYLTLQQQDTAELLYASGLSQNDSISNGTAVLSQAAKLLSTSGSTQSSDGQLNYTSIPDLPKPGTPVPKTSNAAPSTTAATTPAATTSTAIAAPKLKSVTDILAESDASAQAALTAFSKAPAGSSLIDFSA
jgi:hypothetical protein